MTYPHTQVVHTKGIPHILSYQEDELNVGSLLGFKPTKGCKTALQFKGILCFSQDPPCYINGTTTEISKSTAVYTLLPCPADH